MPPPHILHRRRNDDMIEQSHFRGLLPPRKEFYMATLRPRNLKNGVSWEIKYYLDKKERYLTLPQKYSRTHAEEISLYVGKVVRWKETHGELDGVTETWLGSMGDDLRKRFERAGLVEEKQTVTLGELWEKFLEERERDGKKDSTLRTYITVQKRFFPYFDPDADPESVTKADCLEWLGELENEYAEASIAGCIQRSTTVFSWAVEKGFIRENPFKGIPRRSFVNETKRVYIPKEWYLKLLDACPDQTWRTLLAITRYGGLRNPSETLRLQWSDVNWEKNRLKVTSPKTEGHRGHESRVIPIFPEVRKELERQFEQAEEGGSPFVIDRWRDTAANLRTHFERIIFRAGLSQWPDLFQNLRRSCEIDLQHAGYAAYVTAAWMGHSPTVAAKYYLFPTDADFERAATPQPETPDRTEPLEAPGVKRD